MPESDGTIRSLLLPLEDSHLLLPGTIVAEVVGYTPPQPSGIARQPDWLLGIVEWRGQRLPCVAFEALNGRAVADVGTRARTVVLKAVSGRPGMPYIAIRVSGIPRLTTVDRESLESPGNEIDGMGPGVREAVLAQGEKTLIPDLEYIEARTHKALFS